MTLPILQAAVNAGEISPSLFGRVDLEKYRRGCSTLRNMYASYRGGAFSRAGLKFVGQCKQTASATSTPPQLIPFQFSVAQGYALEFGHQYMRVISNGAYVTTGSFSITSVSQANPGVVQITGNTLTNSDWVFLANIGGMPRLSGNIYEVANATTTSITLKNTLTGQAVDTRGFGVYTTGGTAAKIFTLTTPYAIADIDLLKWTQSADVMTLTHPSYPPYDLSRLSAANWTLSQTTFSTSIVAPGTCSATASSTTASLPTQYQYCVTAVDADTGEESISSPVATITNSVDIAVVAGTNTIAWSGVTGAGSYNVYKAPAGYNTSVPVGSQFGYIGTAFGLQFADTNIIADFTKVPPLHQNPFATASILRVNMTSQGVNVTSASISVSSPTGHGFVGTPVVQSNGVPWVIVQNGGEGYTSGDVVTFTGTFSVSPAATLTLGPSTGTYPSCATYFQQRRFYADTLNNPDTYYASQPGAFTNMDTSNPTQDSDAITGTPWAQQVNGIQYMIPMPNGLVILTGLGAWQLSGGPNSAAVTPADQNAQPQAYNGCNPKVRPITINYDILYVQQMGSVVRDLAYNFFVNIYTGTDMTVLSNHLFEGYTITRWDWAEEPNKLIWAVRSDGISLCQTYLKEQDVYAWSRHDTNGLFASVCVVTEPPVNAPYFIVKRLIQNNGSPVWGYFVERMDNRLWKTIEDSWCLDSALALPQPTPSASLTVSSAVGTSTLGTPSVLTSGSGYSTTTYATVAGWPNTTVSLTINGAGNITSAALSGTLTGGPATAPVVITDPTRMGSGAAININVLYTASFIASTAVFTSTSVGDVIRAGGGIATILSASTSTTTTVVGNITQDITAVIPNDPNNTPVPFASGSWSQTTPVTTVYGLDHLEGMTVGVFADGSPRGTTTVSSGMVTLSPAASQILVGLPFVAQLQTLYLDVPGGMTVQTRRKNVYQVGVRVVDSAPFKVGTNQPDASTQPNGANVAWTGMTTASFPGVIIQSDKEIQLFTGDIPELNVKGQWAPGGQVAFQQDQPVPFNLLACVPWVSVGDDPG